MKKEPRFPLEFQGSVALLKRKGAKKRRLEALGVSLNLSLSGLGIELKSGCSFKVGDAVRIKLLVGEGRGTIAEIKIKATVIWVRGSRCGVEIFCLEGASRAFYHNLLMGYQVLSESLPSEESRAA